MKKRVRVYKAGGQSNQPTQEQIVDYISQRMSADDFDGDTDSLKAELSQVGVEDAMADNYISYVSDNLGLEDNAQLDEETQLAAEQEQANSDEEQALLEEQQAAEEQARQQQQEAMYNVEINPEDTEDTPEDEDTYMRQGGTNLSKRSFIKQYTKFAKMAQGGDAPSPGSNDVLNGREAHVKGFLGAVKNTAQDAVLREEAENEYNSAYGAPQVGAFQDGGIQQEQIDTESPLDHWSKAGANTRHIFSDNMYTQNDVAAMEQFGGNTGEGLYKFIGGGDNESADEEYQDSDIDFNQEQYQSGGFKMPGRSGRQYAQAVNSPYYTATGQTANPVDLANRKVTSVNVTKRGIFGRPKAYTVNYDGSTSTTPATNPATNPVTRAPGEYTGPDEFTGRRQPLANFMMRTGIPGVKGLGAKMIKSEPLPEYNVQKNDPDEIKRIQRFHPNYTPFGLKEEPAEKKYKKPSVLDYYSPELAEKSKQMEDAKKIESDQDKYIKQSADEGQDRYQEHLLNLRGPAYTNNGVAPISNVPVNPIVNTPTVSNNNVDPSVVASLNAYNNDPEALAEVQKMAALEDQKNKPVINEEQTNALTPFVSEKEPATSSQDEEFCYPGGTCFKLPEEQRLDSQIFNDLPRQLAVHSDNNNKNWLTGERTNQQLDLSKLNKQDVIEAINSQRTGVNSPFHRDDANYNIDEYADKWLKFQQDNQREFGNTNYNELSDPYNTPEGEAPYQKYTEWLNASGTTDKENPYNIFNAKGMLREIPAKAYGGPIDYTQYAYGGDISVPELYRAQTGLETNAFDPNANPLGTKKDYKGDTVDFTGKVIKKRDSNFSFGEDATKLKNPFAMGDDYKNPLTGEKPAVRMSSEGAYKDNTASDISVDPKAKQGTSEDYLSKKNWDKTRDNFALGKAGVLAGLDQLDKFNARKQENQLLENITAAESNYGISNKDNRGNYDPNSGLFRPDQMGSNAVVKYGGGIYAMGGNTMDEDEDIEYMTEDQIKRFLAEGGELEYV
jgi:hypothetical protein